MNTHQGEDILKEFGNEILIPASADKGVRFLNFLIDWCLGLVVVYAAGYCLGAVLVLTNPNIGEWIAANQVLFKLFNYSYGYLVIVLFYSLQEGLLKGRTIGKLITGTVAIREDGQPLTWGDVFGRSFSRIVPFEPFSGFSVPWHDTWTNTTVVKKADLVTM